MKLKESCPSCGHPLECELKGILNRKFIAHDYCGSCGTRIYSSCPKCGDGFKKLEHYCPHCGYCVYDPTEHQMVLAAGSSKNSSVTGIPVVGEKSLTPVSRISEKSERMIKQLERDDDDSTLFLAELLRVLVRLNPVSIQLVNYFSSFGMMNENMENHQKVEIFRSALSELDMATVIPQMNEHLDLLSLIVKGLVSSYGEYQKIPELSPILSGLPDIEMIGDVHVSRIVETIRRHFGDLPLLQQYSEQLIEFFPRYESIMTRSGFMEFLVGLAAGLIVGPAAITGGQIWEGWRNQSDEQFMRSFLGAIQQFGDSAAEFHANIQNDVEPIIRQIASEVAEIDNSMISEISRLCYEGHDIEKYYNALHKGADKKHIEENEWFAFVFNIAIDNLRGEGLSSHSESNIRRMIGL